MSKCCKSACWCKYLPHNWLCLKGLYVVFTVLFYLALVLSIYVAGSIFYYFYQYNDHAFFATLGTWPLWATLGVALAQTLGGALVLLTLSKILKALAKIKHAVAPCCQEEAAHEKKAN